MKGVSAWTIVLGLVLIGCAKQDFSKGARPRTEQTLTYALPANPTTLDPGRVQDVDTGDLLGNIYEGLVSYSDQNTLVPQLAESWTVSPDGRTYTFRLRNAKFHNGQPVTAQDFKWTFERNLAPQLASPTAANYLGDIVGVAEVAAGHAKEVSGVRAIDPKTLAITITAPRSYFVGKLTYPCAFVLDRQTTPVREIASVREAIGTGPFKLARFSPEQSATLDAFPDYYLGAPKLAHIERPVIKDASTRLLKYKNKELDFLSLERQDISTVEADPILGKQLVYAPRPAVDFVGINPARNPVLQNRGVRRAMAMAINRERIATELLANMTPARGLIPPGVQGYREGYPGLPFDPAKARAELAAAGYPDGKGLPALTLTLREQRPDTRICAEAVAGDLKKYLNWEVKLRTMEWRSFLEARNRGELALHKSSWYADYLDPENFLSFLMKSNSPQNYDGYRNPAFDALTAKADASSDQPLRLRLYQEAEDLVIQDARRIPIYYPRDALLVSPKVSGLRSNLFGQLPHLTVTLQP